MSYESTLAYIHSVKWQGSKPGLSRTRHLLAALDNPEQNLKFVHIAGTNGKGSTAACIAACLQAAGCRVGLYTSPYINRFNERMQVDGVPIPDDMLEALVEEIRPAADAMADPPTEFELITALGFLYFAREGCDLVVLEVGLGGALDSTNVIDPPEAAVITALGPDHMEVLGGTMTEIARWFSNGKSGELPVELLVQQGAREEVYFMPKETEIQEVLDIFADNLWEKKISPLILITETGSKRETPVGIISIYDIARILETLI